MLVMMMLVVMVVLSRSELVAMLVLMNQVWLNMVTMMVSMRMHMWWCGGAWSWVLGGNMMVTMMMLVAFRDCCSFRLHTLCTLFLIEFHCCFSWTLLLSCCSLLLHLMQLVVVMLVMGFVSHIAVRSSIRLWRVMTTVAVQLSPLCMFLLVLNRVAICFSIRSAI
jgi:hypothetical protein